MNKNSIDDELQFVIKQANEISRELEEYFKKKELSLFTSLKFLSLYYSDLAVRLNINKDDFLMQCSLAFDAAKHKNDNYVAKH
jgi:hypothetical protein